MCTKEAYDNTSISYHCRQDKYQLLQYIQELELSTEQFIEAFTLSLRLHVVDVYSKDLEHLQDSPIVTDVVCIVKPSWNSWN